jgi:hypothetical protein
MKRLILALICFSLASATNAALVTGFESPEYTGSTGGTLLTGQQGWYLPVTSPVSSDFRVYTYTGNPYNIVANPLGGAQFTAGRSADPAGAYGRAERPYNWSAEDYVTVSYDFAGLYNGIAGGAADNLGSFSLQPSTTARYWQSIMQWDDEPAATHWTHGYYTLENPATAAIPWVPGPAWATLATNHWYRFSTRTRMSTQEILAVSVTDLTTGSSTTVNLSPPQHFMTATGPIPTAFRFFAGGSVGNITAWDNLTIPEPATLALLLIGFAALRRR